MSDTTQTASNAASEMSSQTVDEDFGLSHEYVNGPNADIDRSKAKLNEAYGKLSSPVANDFEERLTKLETLARQYFGNHHFETPAPVFDAEAEYASMQAEFVKRAQAIAEKAKAQTQAT